MGWKSVLTIAALLLLSTSGCSYLFYPHAKEFTEKAKGATGLDTLVNLTTMAETSAQAAKGGKGVDQSFDDLHNQFQATMGRVDAILDKLNNGQGTLGQLLVNPQLYESLDGTTREMQGLLKDFRANPKKFLRIKLGLF